MLLAAMPLASMAAVPAGPVCISVPDLLTSAAFAKYPATSVTGLWRAPDVRSPAAHLYRTTIQRESADPPDFAGHYKIVRIGCGAGVICPAIVDRLNGRVIFSPELRSVGWLLSDFAGGDDVERLTYRRDSRLLAVFGYRNEDERTGGVTLYDWRNGKPRLVRFVPAKMLCQEDAR